jgi:hypothetical protein
LKSSFVNLNGKPKGVVLLSRAVPEHDMKRENLNHISIYCNIVITLLVLQFENISSSGCLGIYIREHISQKSVENII